MAAPAPYTKTEWPELEGEDLRDALVTISQQRPDVTGVFLIIGLTENAPPNIAGGVRVIINIGIDENGPWIRNPPPPRIG
ncbi:hypothetical protein BDA96_05G142600 [Sorghum bicolor]|uniref:Uncharacterized protein n=2 Tax=Sorghum bicolor TaxID=4558 RepID=A0A921UFS2_SORBI|nr:hypothetical protein BDA96_05G142600 [Sorghum bicolor]OQU83517.1 hypothetical protein SORBI_3005G129800 [Sorghum bicolor]